ISSYFLLNLALTFYNKFIMIDFPFPYFITALHAGSGTIGCLFLRGIGQNNPQSTTISQSNFNFTRIIIVFLYSTLYAANIAISNASLRLVSVPFHQIVRSTCPIFTLVLGFLLLSNKPQRSSLFALLPIVFGAAFACFGDVNATTFGFILTVLGTTLAALKTVVTNLLQALELLEVMSALACVQCLLASQISGELQQIHFRFATNTSTDHFNWFLPLLLIGNGFVAFLLNFVSFKTNKVAGPLTMTVVGNLKQVVTILLAFRLLHLQVQSINIIGIIVALFGTAWYGMLETSSKKR
ncbi:TPT-domain-containing protein, partial [Meira miltonrushii]